MGFLERGRRYFAVLYAAGLMEDQYLLVPRHGILYGKDISESTMREKATEICNISSGSKRQAISADSRYVYVASTPIFLTIEIIRFAKSKDRTCHENAIKCRERFR